MDKKVECEDPYILLRDIQKISFNFLLEVYFPHDIDYNFIDSFHHCIISDTKNDISCHCTYDYPSEYIEWIVYPSDNTSEKHENKKRNQKVSSFFVSKEK
jgi:hypothetical protein